MNILQKFIILVKNAMRNMVNDVRVLYNNDVCYVGLRSSIFYL